MNKTPRTDAALAEMVRHTGYAKASAVRVEVARELEQQLNEADAYIVSLWRNNLLPRPMSETLRARLSKK